MTTLDLEFLSAERFADRTATLRYWKWHFTRDVPKEQSQEFT